MRDYLEELLDLLTQEDEEAAEGWGAQAASLLLDKPLEAGAPADEVGEESGSGESRKRPWMERGPMAKNALEFEKAEIDLELDAALDQKTAVPDFPKETDEVFTSGGGRSVTRESGPAQAGAVLLEQVRSRKRPALLQQAQELERQASQAQALAQNRQSRSLAPALTRPSRGQASFSSQTGEGSGGRQNSGGAAWTGGEEQARLIDRAFQRDSRRYDRGFSLY